MEINKNKEIIGKFFFALSMIFLAYLFLTPLNHLICSIDEFFTMTVIGFPVTDILTVTANDVHPPLFYLIAKAVGELGVFFGIDLLYSLKLLTICAFILMLIICATKIRKEYGWLTAGLSAFALSVMADFGWYHLISRMYDWAILFILIIFLFFKNIINDETDKKSWIFLTIFSVLAAYSHYFAAITAGCIYLILLAYLIGYRKQDLKTWILSVVAAILLYIPWLPSLVNQLHMVHEGYWIPEITLESIIIFLGYYAPNDSQLFSIFSILVLITIIIIYKKESRNIGKKDQFIILSGIGVYIGTIILGVSISEIFAPIIDDRYLMPATGILWLSISIILSKIENKKNFLIILVLISIIIIAGVANTISILDSTYEHGTAQKEILDNISRENNSIVIVNPKLDAMYYLYYSNVTEMYIPNESSICGLNLDKLNDTYDFKTVDESQIDELIRNNSDKSIYIFYWGESEKIETPLTCLHQIYDMHYYKV